MVAVTMEDVTRVSCFYKDVRDDTGQNKDKEKKEEKYVFTKWITA